jgi:DNA-directed RNA polymerase subunit RPC12/RpoP
MKHNDSLSLLQTYQCEECGKVLTGGFSSFKLHQKFACKEVEEGPQVPCDICGSLFKSKTHVQQHKKRTHINVPVVCDICGTVCKNKHSLNSHKRRHDSKNKKHVCDNCGKAFITNLLLIMHIRTHTKEKPFKCPLCDHRCAIKQNIQKHSLNVHKRQIKCADIITVSGTELQDYNSAKQHDEEFKATHGVVDSTKMHTHGKSLQRKNCRQNDKIIDFQNYSSNFSPDMYKNNTDKGYQFNAMDVAYDLSLCKQNQEVSAGNEIQPVSVDFHPGSNVAVTISPATNYTELTTCKLNPFSYSQTNTDSSQFQTSWGNTENR